VAEATIPATGIPTIGPASPVYSPEEQEIVDDLLVSGLKPRDLRIQQVDVSHRAACNAAFTARGYIIPYFSATGTRIPFYRIKILNSHEQGGIKYRQPKKSQNHIYFPPGFKAALDKMLLAVPAGSRERVILITEGEKKAAAATVLSGFPCVGLAGVDSWRSRTIVLPTGTELYQGKENAKNAVRAKLPASDMSIPELMQLAQGFGELIDLIMQHQLTPVLVYDTDEIGGLKAEVQRAATMLAYELRYLGVGAARIKQVILPNISRLEEEAWLTTRAPLDVVQAFRRRSSNAYQQPKDIVDQIVETPSTGSGPTAVAGSQADLEAFRKTAIDDFLLIRGAGPFRELVLHAVHDQKAFPRHPNPKGFLNVQLQGAVSRKDGLQIGAIVISELDARGLRLRDVNTRQPYYYDGDTHKLMPAQLLSRSGEPLHETAFGTLLYKEYGLSVWDIKVIGWIASQFTGEEPVHDVLPRRIVACLTEREDPLNPDGIALQLSDSQFVVVSPDPEHPIQVLTNGSLGLLFEQDQVEPLDIERMLEFFDEFMAAANDRPADNAGMPAWWLEVLEDSNVGRQLIPEDAPPEQVAEAEAIGKRQRLLSGLLCYVSPFLHRWRNTQLPIEMMIGEAGSGKSSLYSLRLQILTGRPHLRNMARDLRDWQASLANSGGLHVTDNVNIPDKSFRQMISDEICRIITEPKPFVEMRRLYTNADLIRIPVTTTFAITAISQPFTNADIMQRAVVSETRRSPGRNPEGEWVGNQLSSRGGREAWYAHHLLFLHRFLLAAQSRWDPDFRTNHRLINFEQVLKLAMEVLGLKPNYFRTSDIAGINPEQPIDHSPQQPKSIIPGGPTDPSMAVSLKAALAEGHKRAVSEADWVLEGIREYMKEIEAGDANTRFTAGDIAAWAQGNDYNENYVLNNSRRLGRYIAQHFSELSDTLGLKYAGKDGNRPAYCTSSSRHKRPHPPK